MENQKPKAPKAIDASVGHGRKSVMLDLLSHQQLDKAANKLHTSNGEYASAAIAFFAESGLDPTAERPAGLADVNSKVSIETRAVRLQNADIGNRLIGIMRTWEKALYGFLNQHQIGTLNYLEQIENTIIRHQVAVETNYFAPMIELLVKSNVEAYMGRMIGEKTNLNVMGHKESDWPATHKDLNTDRDRLVVEQVRTFLQANSVAKPSRAPKPVVPEIPKPVITTDSTAAKTGGVIPK